MLDGTETHEHAQHLHEPIEELVARPENVFGFRREWDVRCEEPERYRQLVGSDVCVLPGRQTELKSAISADSCQAAQL
jgi:hypothetical protein